MSTVPVNLTTGAYLGGGKGILWALNARTGVPEWSFDQVQNLWGNPAVNSGGGLWEPASFDSQGNIYMGIANPGPIGEGGWPKGYPWGTSRPGPDLYTDSVVKLSPAGKPLWYYQLTPHDLYDWDLQNSPVLTTAAAYRLSHRTTAAPSGAFTQTEGLKQPDPRLAHRTALSARRPGRDIFRLCRRARLAAGGQLGATTPATLTCSAAASRRHLTVGMDVIGRH